VAAIVIQSRREWLHGTRGLRRLIGSIPLWTAGAFAGVAGSMLAALLFFLADPRVEAASSTTFDSQPTFTPLLEITPAVLSRSSTLSAPKLTANLDRTRLPDDWDDSFTVTATSQPNAESLRLSVAAIHDVWKRFKLRGISSFPFQPYVSAAVEKPASATVVSSEFVATDEAHPAARRMGLTLEKHVLNVGETGKFLMYQIRVRNSSDRSLDNVVVREWISAIERVSAADPPAVVSGNELVWDLGELPPGAPQVLNVSIVPDQPGRLETETVVVPTSRVGASVAVRASDPPEVLPEVPARRVPENSTAPQAPEIKLSASDVGVLQTGETLSMTFSVMNVGNAPAEDVALHVQLSDEFQHRYGKSVKHLISRLEPGETRRALLLAVARDGGTGELSASLTLGGTEQASHEIRVPIDRPMQQLSSQPEATPGKSDPFVHAE
jgi:hypothetical protein